MRHLDWFRVATVAALALAACGGGDSNSPNTPVDIGGTWQFASNINNSTVQVSCNFAGTVVIAQSGSQANGTYSTTVTCTGPGGTVQDQGTGTISGGQINGNRISFRDDAGCAYSGTASGSPPNAMAGNVTCVIGVSGTNYTFRGTWSASR